MTLRAGTFIGRCVWGAMALAGSGVAASSIVLAGASATPQGAAALAEPTYLKAFNTGRDDWFGSAVALSGNTLVVGAPLEGGSEAGVNPPSNEHATYSGAAYVFVRVGGLWVQEAYLKASTVGAGDRFGFSVAISGDTIVVGAPWEDGDGTGVNPPANDSAMQAGAAYVFVRRSGVWTEQACLKASNTGPDDYFGYSVAISGDTVVVGAIFEDGGGAGVNPASDDALLDSGAAYAFRRSGNTWSGPAYLKASNPGIQDFFGASVAVSADLAVVGAPEEDGSRTGVNPTPDDLLLNAGAAYAFVRTNGTWSFNAYLKSRYSMASDFGRSVAVSGNTVVVGEPGFASLGQKVGIAHVFERGASLWRLESTLNAAQPRAGTGFGSSVAVSGRIAIVGAPLESGGTGFEQAGAAHLYVREGVGFGRPVRIQASNSGAGDHFGSSVAVSGGVVAGGAPLEDGGGQGAEPVSVTSSSSRPVTGHRTGRFIRRILMATSGPTSFSLMPPLATG